MEERLQKFLANQGICSRRKAEEYILAGKVKVNGQVVTELGTKINPEKDKIKYNCLTGIILIIFNISMKFLIYGNTAIWLNDMPTYPSEEKLSPEIEIFKSSMYRMIPFLIINVCITIIYIRKMYDKKIYNKKTDVLFPIIILVVNLILVYFLIIINYKIAV